MQVQESNINFKSAADINLRYIVKNHSKHLPQRVLECATELCRSGAEELPALYQLHADIYKPLLDAQSLEIAQIEFPEFKKVISLPDLNIKRSKAIDAIRKIMPMEDFSLDLLKKLYTPRFLDSLVQEYGMTNRSLLAWLINKLQITKLSSQYLKLLMMSNEAENSRIAERSRQAILRDPETQARRLAKAADTHRTPEYRAKKRQEMIDFYRRTPEAAQKTSLISKMTWDLCPEIKEALSVYTRQASSMVKALLSKRRYSRLNELEQRIISGYYKGFWDSHPEYKEIYQKARLQVIEELSLQK